MSTVRSITADCATEDGTEVTFETADSSEIEGAILLVQIVGSNKRVYLTADDLQLITEFMHREMRRAAPEPAFEPEF